MKNCSIAGCDKPANAARGWCRTHYMRWKRHGDPHHVTDRKDWTRPTLADRFWPKVEKTDTCWLWTAALNQDGYGIIKRNGVMVGAHRVAYEMAVGAIPDGQEIDHLCSVRRCVNPAHLEAVTHAVNLDRSRWVPHNSRKTHCKRGHPFDEENTYVHPSGKRQCRTCLRNYAREWQRKRRTSSI